MAKPRPRTLLVALSVALGASVFAAVQQGALTIDGRTTPADVRTINGSAYVRLADVAKALDLTVVSKGNGRYELTKAGGAGPIGGRAGRIGDVLFDGKWRFTALSFDVAQTYDMKTDAQPYNMRESADMPSNGHTLTAGRNYNLIIVRCRVSNGTKERHTLWTAISDDRIRTAIADTDGSSHVPIAYDFSGGPTQTPWLLPGSSLTFNVVFSIPTDAKPKDLVFTLKNNQGDEKGNDVRVSLMG